MLAALNSKDKLAPKHAINLMEPVLSVSGPVPANAGWFTQARLGMFVHYGLYSLHGCGEWHMYYEKVPAEEYNLLANDFRAENFDAQELVGLAKRAGAGYVVLGARHHEGFCLWDTQTTDFNSVKTAAKRDLIGEYVEACRGAGLRVGIYYSIMSWQWPAIFTGPVADPEGWNGMVEETHEQIAELLGNYGQIDVLWYDGCVVPGLGDAELRSKYWRSRELNAMARRLQPNILINDRSASPEDITTPEQHLTPPPPGRLWECCQTIGDYWGWHSEDRNLKSSKELVEQLIFCARNGGNLLINVGPGGDGAVPEEQAVRMEAVGRWMKANGEAIRGSERTPFTEAEHVLGQATLHGRMLYFHLAQWPEGVARIAGVDVPIESARLLSSGEEFAVEQKADGTATIVGLCGRDPVEGVEVLALKLARPLARKAPPCLLIAQDSGRHDPAEAPVCVLEERGMERNQKLTFAAPTAGRYRLELNLVAEAATPLVARLDGKLRGETLEAECGNYPNTVRMEGLVLGEGMHVLDMHGENALLSLRQWRLQPLWKTVGVKYWRTVGPFPTEFHPQGSLDQVRDALQKAFPPEGAFDCGSRYIGVDDLPVRWQTQAAEKASVSLAQLCGGELSGVCYARTTLISPEARDLDILLGCDWWANLFVNGKLVCSQRDPAEVAKDGAWFNGWKPTPARVQLKQGENVLLVKCHPGSIDNWFTFFLNDSGDLVMKP